MNLDQLFEYFWDDYSRLTPDALRINALLGAHHAEGFPTMQKVKKRQTLRANISPALLLSICFLLGLWTVLPVLAQHIVKTDPKSPSLVTLPEFGRMKGTLLDGNVNEDYGYEVHALGPLGPGQLSAWIVARHRIDSTVPHFIPLELILYKGVKGSLPAVESGQRIGPAEILSNTWFRAAGDWNSDGILDILTDVSVPGDTSFINPTNGEYPDVVVWWGNETGTYSPKDTTHLSCGHQKWAGTRLATNIRSSDGIDNLVIWTWGIGLNNGKLDSIPQLVGFQGHTGQKWGRNGVSSKFTWSWWSPPTFNRLAAVDQNCDDARDLILTETREEGEEETGWISVLYGRPHSGGLPDTNDVETVDLKNVRGATALLTDVSGDGVPELCVGTLDEHMRVYAGKPGVRLKEQFGSGDDGPDSATGRLYRRPWASIPLPHTLDDVFATSGNAPQYQLGPAGTVKTNDIWVLSYPWIVGYSMGENGECLDSLFDVIIFPAGQDVSCAVNLGDIDGSGVNTMALGFSDFSDVVQFVKPASDADEPYCFPRYKMNPPGQQCGSHSAIVEHASSTLSPLTLEAIPNPARGEILLQWDGVHEGGSARISIRDLLGKEVRRKTVDATSGATIIDLSGLPSGKYYASIVIHSELAATTSVFVAR